MFQKLANSAERDQTALLRAVWSGSPPFAKELLSTITGNYGKIKFWHLLDKRKFEVGLKEHEETL